MQELVCADLDLTATGGLSQGRQADRHARQDWLQNAMAWSGRPRIWWCSSFVRLQSAPASSIDSRARKLIEWFTHALPRRRLFTQRHHRAGLECPVPRLRIQVADDRVPCGAHRRQLEVLRDLPLVPRGLQTLPGLPLVVAGVARRAGKLDVAKARQVGMNAPVVLGQRPTDLGRESACASFAGRGGTPLSVLALRLPNIGVTRVENFAPAARKPSVAVYAVAAGA